MIRVTVEIDLLDGPDTLSEAETYIGELVEDTLQEALFVHRWDVIKLEDVE